jgi:hypothetical protein
MKTILLTTLLALSAQAQPDYIMKDIVMCEQDDTEMADARFQLNLRIEMNDRGMVNSINLLKYDKDLSEWLTVANRDVNSAEHLMVIEPWSKSTQYTGNGFSLVYMVPMLNSDLVRYDRAMLKIEVGAKTVHFQGYCTPLE